MGFWGIPVNINATATNPYDSDVSTVDTVHQMIALTRASASNPLIASVVNSCLASIPLHHTKRDLVRAIFWWVKRHIVFSEDESIMLAQMGLTEDDLIRTGGKDLLISPLVLLQMPNPTGDCDDFSMLCGALLLATQIPCWFVTIAVDSAEPQKFSHVYVKAFLDDEKQMVSLDCSHGAFPGWECKQYFRRQEWFVG